MSLEPLRDEQIQYIKDNYLQVPIVEIAKELNISTEEVLQAIQDINTAEQEIPHLPKPTIQLPSYYCLNKGDYLWGLLPFLFSLFIYILTLPRGLYAGDSGQYASAGYVLGIPQPPGYPLWMLLVKIATVIFHPFFAKESAQASMMSALLGSTAVYLFFLFLLKLTGKRFPSIAGSLLLAFSAQFWKQAILPEVHSLHLFFVIACLYLLLMWSEKQEGKYLIVLYLVSGLALAHQYLFMMLPLIFCYFMVSSIKSQGNKTEMVFNFFLCGFVFLVLYAVAVQLANILSMVLIHEPLPMGDTFFSKFMLVLLVFPIATLCFYASKKDKKTALFAFLLFLVGYAIELYLPMRIISHPVFNWGDEHNLYDIYNHISRRQYGPLSPMTRVFPFGQESMFALMGPWDLVKEQFQQYFILVMHQFGSIWNFSSDPHIQFSLKQYLPSGGFPHGMATVFLVSWTLFWVILLVIGLFKLAKTHLLWFITSVLIYFAYSAFIVIALNNQTTNHSMQIVSLFFGTGYIILCLWITFGLSQVYDWLKLASGNRDFKPAIGVTMGLILIFVPLKLNYWNNNLSRNNINYDFGMNILNSMNPNGTLFIIGNNPTFSMAYLSYIEHKISPDQIYDEGENLFKPIHDFGYDKFRIPVNEHSRLKDIGRARITMRTKTPVYYMSVENPTPPTDDPDRYRDYPDYPKIRQVPTGMVYQVLRPGDPIPDYEATLKKMKNLDDYFYNMSSDYYTRELVCNYHFLIGRAYYQLYTDETDQNKKIELKKKAFDEFAKCSETGWDLDNMHINLANLYRQENLNDKALDEFDKAILIQPRKAISYFQMADLMHSMGKSDEAIEKLKKGITLKIYDNDAFDPTAYFILGNLELEKAEKIRNTRRPTDLSDAETKQRSQLMAEAIEHYQYVIQAQPNNFNAIANLGECYFLQNDLNNAAVMWQKAVALNPDFTPALMRLAIYYRDTIHDQQKSQEYYSRAMQSQNKRNDIPIPKSTNIHPR